MTTRMSMRMRMRMRIRDGDGAWRPMENARFFFSALAISTAPEAQATAISWKAMRSRGLKAA
jgi:hypothetical protein